MRAIIISKSRRWSYRFRLGAAWRRQAYREAWWSRTLADIDSSGKTVFQAVGLARSGTTLLGGLLDQQPGTVCLSEPFRSWCLYGSCAYDDGNWTRHPADLVELLCAQRPEPRIGIKETFYTAEHRDGHANAHFFTRNAECGVITIAIIRDPRDIYASEEAYLGYSRDEVPGRFIRTWNEFVVWATHAAACVVRYEDLALTPSTEMQRALSVLGHTDEPRVATIASRRGLGDSTALRGGIISTASIGGFTSRLQPAKAEAIAAGCREHMLRLRYL
jgi:hypothetical protein